MHGLQFVAPVEVLTVAAVTDSVSSLWTCRSSTQPYVWGEFQVADFLVINMPRCEISMRNLNAETEESGLVPEHHFQSSACVFTFIGSEMSRLKSTAGETACH